MFKTFNCVMLVAASAMPSLSVANELNSKFERRLVTEAEDRLNIEKGISFLQRQAAGEGGKLLRGTHAKGVCVTGDLEVYNLDQSSGLKLGMFSLPGIYPTTIRFANADGKILPDQEPDVRAVSLAVTVPPALSNQQGRMDFAMNNASTFPINDAHVFANLMVVAERGVVKGGWAVGLSGINGIRKAIALGNQQKDPAASAYQAMKYWSTVPFQLGPDQAVKYALTPCADNMANPLTAHGDTLSLELKRHVQEDASMSCFELQVQVLDAQRMTDEDGLRHSPIKWVENATWEWNEMQAPFQSVAKLTLKRDSVLSNEKCEALRINVSKNSSATHRGLGSINRVRAAGESISGRNR